MSYVNYPPQRDRVVSRSAEPNGYLAALRGMIAADLVIGAAVGRAQIDVLELAVL